MDRETFYRVLQDRNQRFEMLEPELELTVRDPKRGVEGFVVCWNTIDDPSSPLGACAKGGTRITPTITLDEVKMLAKTMSLKNAAAGLPLGGAKSGLRADPDEPGFEQRYRRFVSLVKPILRENGGIFGGFGFDIGARPEHPLWACDELGSFRSFTGKPVALGGSDYDVEGCAGLGVSVAAETACRMRGIEPQGGTFAVQGAGAMGAAVIRYFTEAGASLRAVSDPILGGTICFEDRPSSELLDSLGRRDHQRSLALIEQERCTRAALDDILDGEVDVFFPCALQHVLTGENSGRVRAKMIVEGANNPCTPDARTALGAQGVTVIPDFIANPGGIIAAFVELTSKASPEENAKTRVVVRQAKEMTRTRVAKNTERILLLADEMDALPVDAGRFLALGVVLGESYY